MTEVEAISILENHGWICGVDEAGDRSCSMDLGDKVVRIFPTIGKRSNHFRVTFMPSISSRKFSAVVSSILGEDVKYDPVIVSNEIPEKLAGFSVSDVLRLSEKAISWANAQNLEAGLAAYRDLPTDAKGAMPLRHLAALAIAGEVSRLGSYRQSFEKGNRLGFVPYITSAMLDRAISIAQEHAT
ncbi:hypothetical protein RTH74_07035 [Pseudomonas sp. zfem001]|uniref:DUF6990 domain-containing protein n=1 Tax=Pseudomonas sp. zfem001 TaxID=3078196 RepID=UPI0029291F85|nr:hypothetical protein [Pseudomonas sp. zfem001]MDU9407347.1 hypothetical protein [Pseudomonas sp. zfem001]